MLDSLALLGRSGLRFLASLGRAHLLMLGILRGLTDLLPRPLLLVHQLLSNPGK